MYHDNTSVDALALSRLVATPAGLVVMPEAPAQPAEDTSDASAAAAPSPPLASAELRESQAGRRAFAHGATPFVQVKTVVDTRLQSSICNAAVHTPSAARNAVECLEPCSTTVMVASGHAVVKGRWCGCRFHSRI